MLGSLIGKCHTKDSAAGILFPWDVFIAYLGGVVQPQGKLVSQAMGSQYHKLSCHG